MADASADKLDAIASEQAAAEAALLAARAEVDGALARAADAIRDRDAALKVKHAAERRAGRLATTAYAATEKARGLQRDLHRATLASAPVETLTEGEIEALVGAACDGADARALAPAAAKLAAAARANRTLRAALTEREAALKMERDAVTSLKAEVWRLRSERGAAAATAAACEPRAVSAAPAPYEIDYDTADVVDLVDFDDDVGGGDASVSAPRAPLAPVASTHRPPPPPLVGAARLGSAAGLHAGSFVAAAGRRRPLDGGVPAQGTFIRHGADGRGGRTAAVRPRGVASLTVAPPAPAPKRPKPGVGGSLASFLVKRA